MSYKLGLPARLLLAILLGPLVAACNSSNNSDEYMQPIAIDWAAVGGKRIVFGHQSVGENILEGVRELATASGVNYSVQETRSPPTEPGITHFRIGQNGDPLSKIRDFGTAIDAGAADGADVAAMKLCYLDFNAATDVRRVADAYIGMLEALSARHPQTRFVAITAPLMVTQTGPKAWVKKALGKQPAQLIENAKRAEFNAFLRERFGASGRLFDLARAEAWSAPLLELGGQPIESLNPILTDDGGHLSATGRALIAPIFLQQMVGEIRSTGGS